MVHEAKLHQFIGQMLAKTLSGAPVWPTVLGSVGALSPSAVSWAGRESLKKRLHRQGAASTQIARNSEAAPASAAKRSASDARDGLEDAPVRVRRDR